MDFSSGNSGNLLREAVIKTGPGCQQEGSYCELLGKAVCPEIYAIIPDGYIMEKLEPMWRVPSLLCDIQAVLQKHVWNRPALPVSTEVSWKECLKVYGIKVPNWVENEESCMVHGDPTTSNALRRFLRKDAIEIIIGDPRPPRNYIPQCRETDLGRLLQSAYGWEVVAYGARKINFYEPCYRDHLEKSRAIFWCGAAAARIEYLERSRANRRLILDWCQYVRGQCYV